MISAGIAVMMLQTSKPTMLKINATPALVPEKSLAHPLVQHGEKSASPQSPRCLVSHQRRELPQGAWDLVLILPNRNIICIHEISSVYILDNSAVHISPAEGNVKYSEFMPGYQGRDS